MNRMILAVLLAAVVALLSGSLASLCFMNDVGTVGARGFVVDTSNIKKTSNIAPGANVVELGLLMAEASIADGQKVAVRCMSCHTMNKNGAHKIGPNLWNVVHSAHGAKEGFVYSNAMKSINEQWTFEKLYKFIHSPSIAIRGTKMSFAGIKDPKELAALLKYLATVSDVQVNMPPKTLKIAE